MWKYVNKLVCVCVWFDRLGQLWACDWGRKKNKKIPACPVEGRTPARQRPSKKYLKILKEKNIFCTFP